MIKFRSISVQIISSMLIVMGLAVIAIAYFSYNRANRIMTEDTLSAMENKLVHEQNVLKGKITEFSGDTLFLSEVPPIQGIIRSRKFEGYDPDENTTEGLWRTRLARIFTVTLESIPEYRKIRFIGKENKAQEIVRVDRTPKGTQVISGRHLQQKDKGEYFSEIQKLKKGEIYLGKFSFNWEVGGITTPHQLMLRIGTPVYDAESGEFFGIVIINVDMSMLMKSTFGTTKDYDVIVSNQQGYYIYHPDPSRLIVFDPGHNYRMQKDYPETNEVFWHKEGKEEEEFKYKERDTAQIDLAKKGKIMILSAFRFDPMNMTRFIMLSLIAERHSMLVRSRQFRNQIIFLSLTITLVLVGVAFANTRRIIRPLTKLTEFSQRVSSGRITAAKIEIVRNDEIGQLTENFNVMTDKIDQYNVKLEQKVDELNAINQQLETSEQELKAANQQLQASEQQLKASNQQLQASEQQLKAANQQLRASEQQLRASNQQLRANEQQLRTEITERKKMGEEREKHLHELEV
ncbi:MAG: HAMP domain-containing protein, partial [Thermodesulfobacteriota bacterium]